MNRARLLLCVAVLVGVATSPLFGQFPELPKIKQFGIDGFRLMLQHKGLETAQSGIGSALEDSPQDTVLVMLGDLSLVPRFSRQINRFVDKGGCLFIASDLRSSKVDFTSVLGIWVRPTGVVRSSYAYRGFRDCPVVTDFNRGVAQTLFEGVESIIANRSGELTLSNAVAQSVAWLPSRRSQNAPVLMAIYRRANGRMLFIADHSILINEMLVHGDNARFVSNVTDWLCEDGKRKKLVVIHDGRVLPAWGLGETPPVIPLRRLLRIVQRDGLESLPIGDSVLPVLNASIADFQQKDEFNYYLEKMSTRLFGRLPIRVVLLLLTGVVGVSFLGWMIGSRSRPQRWLCFQDWSHPIEPKLVGAVRDKQHQPYIRLLAREFFVEAGVKDWNISRAPNVVVDGPASISKTKRNVHKIWEMATARSRRRMSKWQCDRTLNVLKELRELQLSGDLSLEWP